MDGQINPRIDCSQSPLAVRLTPEEVVALDMHAPKEVSEYRRLAKRDLENPPNLCSTARRVYFCGGGHEFLRHQCVRRNGHLRHLAAGNV